jgi:peptide subunit release factor 1 (eRF1)
MAENNSSKRKKKLPCKDLNVKKLTTEEEVLEAIEAEIDRLQPRPASPRDSCQSSKGTLV